MARLNWKGPQAVALVTQAARQGIGSAAVVVQRQAQTTINRVGAGQIYVKRGGRIHRASLPGQPPAKDTGSLGRSVQIDTSGLSGVRGVIAARIGTDQPYGRWMELGTRFIAPRPWLRRSLKQATPRAFVAIDNVLRRVLATARSLPG